MTKSLREDIEDIIHYNVYYELPHKNERLEMADQVIKLIKKHGYISKEELEKIIDAEIQEAKKERTTRLPYPFGTVTTLQDLKSKILKQK